MFANRRRRNVQVGRGIGSILSGIWKGIGPLAHTVGRALFGLGKKALTSQTAKSIAKNVAKEGMTATANIAKDILKGGNFGDSVKRNVENAAKEVANNATKKIDEVVKRKGVDKESKENSNSGPPRKKKKKGKDIFSK